MNRKERSKLWYILPAVFSIVGGLIAYYFLRYDEPAKAKNCLWLGIILFASYVGYYIVFSILLDMFEFS